MKASDLDWVKRDARTALLKIYETYPDLVPGRNPVGVVTVMAGQRQPLVYPSFFQIDVGIGTMTEDQRGKYSALSGYKAMLVWNGLPTITASSQIEDPSRWIYAGGVGAMFDVDEVFAIGFSGQLAAIDHIIASYLLLRVRTQLFNKADMYADMVRIEHPGAAALLRLLLGLSSSSPR